MPLQGWRSKQLDAVAPCWPAWRRAAGHQRERAGHLPGHRQHGAFDIGFARQGVGCGVLRHNGTDPLLAAVSTNWSALVIVASMLGKGSDLSTLGASTLVADAVRATCSCGCADTVVLRRRPDRSRRAPHGVHFSITARKDRAVSAAIAALAECAWTAIRSADQLTG